MMTTRRRSWSSVVAMASIAVLGMAARAADPGVPGTMDATVPGYRKVDASLASAGKPAPEGIEKIKAAGFKTVIDLLPPAEAAKEEAAAVERLGMRYVSIPVTAATLDWDQARAAKKVLDDASSRPVLIHCASGNRVGALVALVRALDGVAPSQALAEGRRAGMTAAPLEARVSDLLAAGPKR